MYNFFYFSWQCEFALGALTQVLNINNGTNVEVATMTASRGIRMLLDDEVSLSLSPFQIGRASCRERV